MIGGKYEIHVISYMKSKNSINELSIEGKFIIYITAIF